MDRDRKHDYEDKILKMLKKAERTTPEEAEALQEQAVRLMIKYGYDQAMIDARRMAEGKAAEEPIEVRYVVFTGIYAKSFIQLGHTVLKELGTLRVLQSKVPGTKSDMKLHIWGYKSDVEQARLLILSLQLQATSALSKWWRTYEYQSMMTAMEKFVEKRTYITGYGEGAARRMRHAREVVMRDETSRQGGTGAELVLVNRKDQVNLFVENKYPDIKKARGGTRRYGFDGDTAGQRDGLKANTGDKPVGNEKRRSLDA